MTCSSTTARSTATLSGCGASSARSTRSSARSKRYTGRVIRSPRAEPASPARLRWSRRLPLTARILAVNIIALGLMAGSLLYLDSYRKQLLTERFGQARAEVQITADALREVSPSERARLLVRIGNSQHLRLRVFAKDGKVL